MSILFIRLLTGEIHLKKTDVVRKISFRYRSVPIADGFYECFNSESDER